MSLTLAEFQASVRPLTGVSLGPDEAVVIVQLGSGRVEIAFEKRPSVRLGGLLDMPRAVVSIVFEDVSAAGQAEYLKRFDLAFQRGGG